MKKVLGLMLVFGIIFTGYFILINLPKSYELTYKIKDYEITEKYDKEKEYYTFDIKYKNINYHYVYEGKYTSSRKLVKDIKVVNYDDYICLTPTGTKFEVDVLCNKDGEFIDKHFVSAIDSDFYENEGFTGSINVEVYLKHYDYYMWTGKGLVELNKKKYYSFLDNESYDNNLAYQSDEYIIIADYDQKREFDKFYIFDLKKKQVVEWKIDRFIDFDSYFMGEVEGYLYLFDRHNLVQYKLNPMEKEISVVSNKEAGKYFDKEWIKKPINELKYYTVTMDDDDIYDYLLKDSNLYMNVDNNFDIKISDLVVDDILYSDEDSVHYIIDDGVYVYNKKYGEHLVLRNFDWQFSYKNKIFIID